jgi:peptide deformylase
MWMANHPRIRPILPDNSPCINSFKSGFMALLPILRYPDPRLHKKAAAVTEVDARIRQLAADMAETMYEAPGIGLAASQVDQQRIDRDRRVRRQVGLMAFINPEICWKNPANAGEEGCLSVPGIYENGAARRAMSGCAR